MLQPHLRTWGRKLGSSLALALVAGSLYTGAAFAQGGAITVTSMDDSLGQPGVCSLRAAVESANTDSNVDGCTRIGSAPYTILLPLAGSYTLSLPGADEDANQGGDLDIRTSLRIVGNFATPEAVIIQAATDPVTATDRVFDITADGARVEFANLTIRHGRAATSGGGIAVRSAAEVLVSNVVVSDNEALGTEATQGGGGIATGAGSTLMVMDSVIRNNRAVTGSGSGGGILNVSGTLTVMDSLIEANEAARAGGGIEANAGSTTLTDVELRANATGPTPGNGGGLHSTGASTVTVTAAVVLSNTATAEGGGLWNSGTGRMVVDQSIIAFNVAESTDANRGGGGLFNVGGPLTVSNSTISQNIARNNGGGIKVINGNADLINVTLAANQGDMGASAVATLTGTVTLRNSILAAGVGAEMGMMNGMMDDMQAMPLCEGMVVMPLGAVNLAEDMSCGAALVAMAFLEPLTDNGNGLWSHALTSVSPAIDAGDSSVCALPPVNNQDQHGASRITGMSCDLGAFESPKIVALFNYVLRSLVAE